MRSIAIIYNLQKKHKQQQILENQMLSSEFMNFINGLDTAVYKNKNLMKVSPVTSPTEIKYLRPRQEAQRLKIKVLI